MSLAAGTSVGHYTIVEPLGSGGMGEAYKARDPKLQRTVAIKVLKDQTDDAATRILTEARAASGLSHPNICVIHEVGEADGQSFIVMEHVEGKPLSELIPSDGLPPESVIRYGTQIADALAHAHEHGIVHRDLKSANVVITPEAQVKLIDFGIAVPLSKVDADAVTRTQESPVSSVRAGTLAYMAPEVLNGQEATARSDIWSLGVLLYEMASGRLPFEGETPLDVVSAIAKETPRALPSRVSAGFRSVVQRCLQKEPGRRYSGVNAVQAALETIQSDTAVTQPTGLTPARRTRGWRWAAPIIGFVLVTGVIGYWLRSAPQDSTSPRVSVPRLTNPTQVTSAEGQETSPTWSPDGSRLAFEARQDADWDIWLTQITGGQPVNMTPDQIGNDHYPSWSPDGRSIAFVSRRDGEWGLYATAAVGGTPRLLRGLPSSRQGAPQWFAGGDEIGVPGYESGHNFVDIVSIDSLEARRVALPDHEGYQFSNLRWSPDGRYLAYIDKWRSFEVTRLWLVPSAGGEPTSVTDGTSNDWSPSWSPDGRTLFFVSNRGGAMDLWQQRISDDGQPEGDARPLTTGVGIDAAVFSPDGTKLAYSKGSRFPSTNVWRIPRLDGRLATWADAEQLTFDDAAFVEWLDLSPDGTRLVMSSDRTGNQDLWSFPSAGGPLVQLTSDRTPDWAPRWSPDGREVAFVAYRTGNREIWVMPVEGGPARQLTSHPAMDFYTAWSPDGRSIAFTSTRAGDRDIWVVPADGGEARQLTDGPGQDSDPDWSPDGQSVVFNRGGGGSGTMIWKVAAAGGVAEAVSPNQAPASMPRWSRDGGTVYFRRPGNLWALTIDDRRERQLTDLVGRSGLLGTGLVADDTYVYFTWGQPRSDIWVMDVEWDEE